MKETVISASEGSRVIRLGSIRYDYRVENLVKLLLHALTYKSLRKQPVKGQPMEEALKYAADLGWRRADNGVWTREG